MWEGLVCGGKVGGAGRPARAWSVVSAGLSVGETPRDEAVACRSSSGRDAWGLTCLVKHHSRVPVW